MASATGSPRPDGGRVAACRGVRTLLLATYLAVLLLPVGGIGFLRLYESALIRQTEAELLAQAAVLSAAYRAAWLERASPEALAAMPLAKSDWGVAPAPASSERWRALLPQLDLADSPILPRAPDPVPAARPADPIALGVAKTLAPVLANVREMTLAGIRIVDAHGIVVASTANADLGLDMVRQEEVAEALQGAPVAMLRERAPLSGEVSWESISRTTRSACSSPSRWWWTAACWARCWCRARRATSCRRCTASAMRCWRWRSCWSPPWRRWPGSRATPWCGRRASLRRWRGGWRRATCGRSSRWRRR